MLGGLVIRLAHGVRGVAEGHLDDLGIRQTKRRLLDLPLGDKLIEPFYIAADGCVVVESFTTQRDVNAPSTLGLQTSATLLFMLAKLLAAISGNLRWPTTGPHRRSEPQPVGRTPIQDAAVILDSQSRATSRASRS